MMATSGTTYKLYHLLPSYYLLTNCDFYPFLGSITRSANIWYILNAMLISCSITRFVQHSKYRGCSSCFCVSRHAHHYLWLVVVELASTISLLSIVPPLSV